METYNSYDTVNSKLAKSNCPKFRKNFSKTCAGPDNYNCFKKLCSANCKNINCKHVCNQVSNQLATELNQYFKDNCEVKGDSAIKVYNRCVDYVNSEYPEYNADYVCNKLMKQSIANNFINSNCASSKDVYNCCLDMVKNQYPGYQPSSICSDFAHPSKPETTIPVESSSIVNDTIQSCVQKGIKGQANCATEILNCCASNKLLTQPNAMQQCYDGATSFCAKNNTLEGFELTKQKPKNKGNDCSMWKMLINIVLIGLLIYLGYLLFEEMSKKSPEDVGTAPTPTGAV